jgi:SAM-dependent methyltransferase
MSTIPVAAPVVDPEPAVAGEPLFSRLSRSYNLLPPSPRDEFFVDLLRDSIGRARRPRRVVDIGCGHGIGMDAALLRRVAGDCDQLIGVEPDGSVTPAPGVFSEIHRSTLEECCIEDGSVDLAYSCMVMEHVQDPHAFMSAIARILRPGGSYVFMTVNGRHYFAIVANLLRRLGADGHVLRLVRGRADADSYHYPTAYRLNDPGAIAGACAAAGLSEPRFVFAEHHGARCYFPGPTRALWHALTLKRRIIRRPDLLLEMIGVVTKPR